MTLRTVDIAARDLESFASVLDDERMGALRRAVASAGRVLGDRIVWNVNSTASGGGVAEMLAVLLAYARGAGVDARWLVIEGNPAFFEVTKRLHNNLHGAAGDGGALDEGARAAYEQTLARNESALCEQVSAGDIVLLHDPQTVGLAGALCSRGANVIWRCHVGSERGNDHTEAAWSFLAPYLEAPVAHVFSCDVYVPEVLRGRRTAIIPPSIDPFAPKNEELDSQQVQGILRASGLVAGVAKSPATYERRDGSTRTVERSVQLTGGGSPPPVDAPLVLQVSRWDRLKDMAGVLSAFAGHIADVVPDGHLVLAGPAVTGISDDPEGAAVLEECEAAWNDLPGELQARVHLASLPMDDGEENAVLVNALQRHAAVVVQKSVMEGFGLTVAEAMWKSRPVVASAIGGITEQIIDGETGVLVHDPHDLREFGAAVSALLGDADRRQRLGARARQRVLDRFLPDRHLLQYLALFGQLLGTADP